MIVPAFGFPPPDSEGWRPRVLSLPVKLKPQGPASFWNLKERIKFTSAPSSAPPTFTPSTFVQLFESSGESTSFDLIPFQSKPKPVSLKGEVLMDLNYKK